MTKDEALKMALEVMRNQGDVSVDEWIATEKAIKEALAQPEQEPMTKAGELRAIKTELWKQTEQDGECKHCTDGCPACDARKLPEQEPVAYINVEQRKLEWAKYMSWDTPTVVNLPKIPLYTTPPQRTWSGLTDEEIKRIGKLDLDSNYFGLWYDFAKALEAKLKEKNT